MYSFEVSHTKPSTCCCEGVCDMIKVQNLFVTINFTFQASKVASYITGVRYNYLSTTNVPGTANALSIANAHSSANSLNSSNVPGAANVPGIANAHSSANSLNSSNVPDTANAPKHC